MHSTGTLFCFTMLVNLINFLRCCMGSSWAAPPNMLFSNICRCGRNDFQDYFDDAKESRVKQVPKNLESKSFKNQVSRFKIQDSRTIKFQESRFKNNQDQDSRLKIQESREDSIKISTKFVFSKTLSSTRIFHKIFYQRVLLSSNRLPEGSNWLQIASIVLKTDLQSCNRLPWACNRLPMF